MSSKKFQSLFCMRVLVALCSIMALLLCPAHLNAESRISGIDNLYSDINQQNKVQGTVSDADGNVLIGATIMVEGTQKFATTDIDGRFTIEAVQGDKLVVSYVGMVTATVEVKSDAPLAIVLYEDTQMIEELVVTGYGTVKKSAYTGSATVLQADKQKDLPVISVTQMMEANMPGVTLLNSNGSPGSNTSIRVRGYGSISASNEPLYVLDGVPVISGNMSANDMNGGGLGILNTLNPADIESITVLKDAASASLYGARGANGVILITTRKGKQGRTSYNFKATYGISDFAYNYRPTMGGDERRELIMEGLINYNMDNGATSEAARLQAEKVIDNYAAIPAGGYADWDDALFRVASQQNYDFSVMGGTENTKFAGSIGYTNQENVAFNSGFERYSGHLNFSNKYKNFDFSMNAMFTLTKKDPLPGGSYYSNPMYSLKTALHPSVPIYNADGSYNTNIPSINNMNLVYENEINDHKSQIGRTFGVFEAGYTFIEGLRLSTLFNIDYSDTREFRYFSPYSSDGATPKGQGDIYRMNNTTYNSQTRLSYQKSFGEHSIDVLAAYEIKKWDYEYVLGEAKNYSTDKKEVLDNASTPTAVGHYINGDSMLSYVVRANYDYKDMYYFSASFRRDGSSRLDPSARWDNFWAVSGSWRFSKEKFMESLSSWFTDGKIRVSYGVNGNLPSGLYSYYGLYSTGYSYNDQPGMVESSLRNNSLSWEKNYAFNAGVDLQLFNRLNITFDWYVRNTKDLLLSKSVNPVTGFGSITDNVGKVRNKGFEIEISSYNIDKNDFTWTTSFNISHNKNTILKLADVTEYFNGRYIVKEGMSLGTIALREYAGVDPQNGLPMYYSNVLLEDGTRSREKVYNPNNAVSVPIADIYPKVSGGLSNTFRYKIFDLSFNLSYSLGGHSYDNYMWALQDDGYSSQAPKSIVMRDRWQKPGDITDIPRYVAGQEYGGWWHSSRGVHSTDHLRLKSLVFGVRAPQSLLKATGLSNARLYFSGTNLLTWAAYDQYDPEMQGVVNTDIPPLKTFAFGIEIGF